jgi:DNA (cytosine-5)-methyltransferase 1
MSMSSRKAQVTSVSLFTGAGGLDLGAHLAGCTSSVCVEIDKDSVATLARNRQFSGSVILDRDICAVTGEEILALIKLRRGQLGVLIGGPPCQPFSKAAYWTSTGDEARRREQLPSRSKRKAALKDFKRRVIDPSVDPRSNLIDEYLRVLEELKPLGFVFENVMSIRHPSSKPIFESFVERCRTAGYAITVSELNAAEFGVPQIRRRIFVVGLRGKQAPKLVAPTHNLTEKNSRSLRQAVTAGDAISRYSGPQFAEPEELVQGRYESHLSQIPPGWNYKALSAWAGHTKPSFEAESRYWHFLLKLHPEKPSWTISASPGPWTGPFHWESRRLRVPEIAALQTFPAAYKFSGSRRSIQRQIGNAVPPLLAKRVVSSIVSEITGRTP